MDPELLQQLVREILVPADTPQIDPGVEAEALFLSRLANTPQDMPRDVTDIRPASAAAQGPGAARRAGQFVTEAVTGLPEMIASMAQEFQRDPVSFTGIGDIQRGNEALQEGRIGEGLLLTALAAAGGREFLRNMASQRMSRRGMQRAAFDDATVVDERLGRRASTGMSDLSALRRGDQSIRDDMFMTSRFPISNRAFRARGRVAEFTPEGAAREVVTDAGEQGVFIPLSVAGRESGEGIGALQREMRERRSGTTERRGAPREGPQGRRASDVESESMMREVESAVLTSILKQARSAPAQAVDPVTELLRFLERGGS